MQANIANIKVGHVRVDNRLDDIPLQQTRGLQRRQVAQQEQPLSCRSPPALHPAGGPESSPPATPFLLATSRSTPLMSYSVPKARTQCPERVHLISVLCDCPVPAGEAEPVCAV